MGETAAQERMTGTSLKLPKSPRHRKFTHGHLDSRRFSLSSLLLLRVLCVLCGDYSGSPLGRLFPKPISLPVSRATSELLLVLFIQLPLAIRKTDGIMSPCNLNRSRCF